MKRNYSYFASVHVNMSQLMRDLKLDNEYVISAHGGFKDGVQGWHMFIGRRPE